MSHNHYGVMLAELDQATPTFEDERLIAAQTAAIMEERQRLARDLHDSVTQALYGIALHAEVARRLLASGDATNAANYLSVLQETAQEALAEMRLLIFDLRPSILGDVGLAAALQVRLETVEGRANLQTQLIVDVADKLPALIEQVLYNIAREALNNALKHAHAQHVTVRVWQTHISVCIEIRDDGIGFDPTIHTNGGLGLCGIAERVAQVKGQLILHSEPKAGTTLRAEIPL